MAPAWSSVDPGQGMLSVATFVVRYGISRDRGRVAKTALLGYIRRSKYSIRERQPYFIQEIEHKSYIGQKGTRANNITLTFRRQEFIF